MPAHRPVRTGEHFQPQPPTGSCQACRAVVDLSNTFWLGWVFGTPLSCATCGSPLAPWDVVHEIVSHAPGFPFTLGLSGAVYFVFSLILDPGETALVELEAMGLPSASEADLLALTYSSPCRGFRPVEILLDGGQSRNRPPPRAYLLYGYPDPEAVTDTEDFLVYCPVMPRRQRAKVISLLAEPLVHLMRGDDHLVAVLLFSALEDVVRSIIEEDLKQTSRGQAARAYARRVYASDAFSVLVPAIAERRGIPPLPSEVARLVDALRSARNRYAHDPRYRRRLPDDVVTAAVLAMVYLHFLQQAQAGNLILMREGHV